MPRMTLDKALERNGTKMRFKSWGRIIKGSALALFVALFAVLIFPISGARRISVSVSPSSSTLAAAQTQLTIEKSAEPPINGTALDSEIERVQTLIKEISAAIANPGTPMAAVIKKNIERAELEGYLKGIRYKAEPR